MGNSSSNIETLLYQKFGQINLQKEPLEIIRDLCAFWQHFALHKRLSDYSQKPIISVFDPNCPYPVWHKDEWLEHANPPQANFTPEKPFFEQLWVLFQKCPIPHNVGAGNENCEYTDDWWYGKNSYLSHSGLNCEDVHYCFRDIALKNCQFCVFSFDSELCTDLINCNNCFQVKFALNSRHCQDSAFLFDCRNCSNCLFCWNLRNKKYCLFNQQLSQEEYEREIKKYDFSSRKNYAHARENFSKMLKTKAWWKNLAIEQSENCSGDILQNCKNCHNCFFLSDSEDCFNAIRGAYLKDNLHTVSCLKSELVYYSSMAQDQCYDIRYCYNVIQCKNLEYCAHSYNCQNCFACCGLVNKKYCILNKEYSPEEYQQKVAEIKAQTQNEGVYGQFFPHHFAACPYEDSLAGFHWPLSLEEQKAQGYRVKEQYEKQPENASLISEIPDRSLDASPDICQKVFWDEVYQRPFQIKDFDLKFCQANQVPLPNSYYIHRLKDNFSLIFFDGHLRSTKCAQSGAEIMTAIPTEYDSRILDKKAYLEEIK